ncbi:hypothetical protein BH09ACT4_BH09ACT4_01600 [soil metagenome]
MPPTLAGPAVVAQRRFWLPELSARTGDIILVVLIALASGALFWGAWVSRYNITNIDGISYISIARHYANGLTDYAINGYWSPAISWLIAPLIVAGLDPLFAFNLVNATVGTATIVLGVLFARRLGQHRFVPALFAFVGTASIALGESTVITPDLLVVAWTIGFAWYLAETDHALRPGTIKSRILWGIGLGALGAVGYFIKLFLVPFFFAALVLWALLRWVTSFSTDRDLSRRRRLRRYILAPLAAIIAFAIVAAPWVGAISAKYGEFTLGSSFAVNISQKFDPESDTGAEPDRDPLQLVAPPNPYAVAYGEDRGTDLNETPAFQSPAPLGDRVAFYISERLRVFPYYLNKIAMIAPFAFLTMVLLALSFLFGWLKWTQYRPVLIVALVWTVYFAGYAAIAQLSSEGGNLRYYWPLLPLSMIAFGLMVPEIWRRLSHSLTGWRLLLALLLILVVPIAAINQNALGRPHLLAIAPATGGISYIIHPPSKPAIYTPAQDMIERNIIPAGSKIVGETYRSTVLIAYYTGSQAYGRSGHHFNIFDPAFRKVLADNDIDFFLTFTPVGSVPPDVSAFAKVIASYTANLRCGDESDAAMVDCQIQVVDLKQ